MTALTFSTDAPQRNRRSSPRLDVLNQVHGALVPFRLPITMRDIGPAGFGAEASVPFPIGARHLFRFTTDGGVQVTIAATARHQRPVSSDTGVPAYLTGFEFVQDAYGKTATEIGFLLDAVTDALQFDEVAC